VLQVALHPQPLLLETRHHHDIRPFLDQPRALQIGRSGCVIDPLLYHHWHFTSYFVDSAGRAKCGPVVPVEEGDEVCNTPVLTEILV
jgi:hypothetical protein